MTGILWVSCPHTEQRPGRSLEGARARQRLARVELVFGAQQDTERVGLIVCSDFVSAGLTRHDHRSISRHPALLIARTWIGTATGQKLGDIAGLVFSWHPEIELLSQSEQMRPPSHRQLDLVEIERGGCF